MEMDMGMRYEYFDREIFSSMKNTQYQLKLYGIGWMVRAKCNTKNILGTKKRGGGMKCDKISADVNGGTIDNWSLYKDSSSV